MRLGLPGALGAGAGFDEVKCPYRCSELFGHFATTSIARRFECCKNKRIAIQILLSSCNQFIFKRMIFWRIL